MLESVGNLWQVPKRTNHGRHYVQGALNMTDAFGIVGKGKTWKLISSSLSRRLIDVQPFGSVAIGPPARLYGQVGA